MNYNRPIVLSIAGFDPCGGAGVLADVKTFEQHRCLGMAINTGITTQVEDVFYKVDWVSAESIIYNLKVISQKYSIDFVKIGIIENLDVLLEVVQFLKSSNPTVTIVWDTVLSASTGFQFINELEQQKLIEALKLVELITPNSNEIKILSRINDEQKGAEYLSQYCSVLLKGGHSEEHKGIDFLYLTNSLIGLNFNTDTEALEEEVTSLRIQNHYETSRASVSEPLKISEKHGSGCILSSAILSNLALGNDLETSCKKAKVYIETILNSNPNLLAYHVA